MAYEGWRIVVDPDVAALKAAARTRDVKCVCPTSPWCRGQSSADWLSCDHACRACKPWPFQPPVLAAGDTALDP